MTKEEILNELYKSVELLVHLNKETDRCFTGYAGDAIGLAVATLGHAIDQLRQATPKPGTEHKEKVDGPMMEKYDSLDGELSGVLSFNQFVDLYPRLVESHDKDFVQKALAGEKIEAISYYFIRKKD